MIKTDKIGGGWPGGAWRQLGISSMTSLYMIYSKEEFNNNVKVNWYYLMEVKT